MSRPVLIIGGTGVFGKRLARHLMGFEGVKLFVSSRSLAKAQAFVATLPPGATPIALDCQKNLADVLKATRPFAVIDCSGPFQTADYAVARAVLGCGAHFIDLADARDYLAGFAAALGPLAQNNGVAALTGASSTPTLSSRVAMALTDGWARVDTIDICITPGGRSEVGRSVIEAILSYAGRPIPIWRGGALIQTTGWGEARRVQIPGLGPRRVAMVETFDAEHLGPSLAVSSRVSFAAGLESGLEQWGLGLLASLRKWGMIGAPDPLIPLLLQARRFTRLPTSDSGGMVVDITGLDVGGAAVQARWSLIAHKDHGPYIPILPAAAALQKLLTNTVPPGAVLAHTPLEMQDILAQMAPYDITTRTDVMPIPESIFQRALPDAQFAELPGSVAQFHTITAPLIWSGEAQITGGTNLFAKLSSHVFGFPKPGDQVPVTVTIDREFSPSAPPKERWTRNFAGTEMASVLDVVRDGVISETFGPFTFDLRQTPSPEGLRMEVAGWRMFGLPLPKILSPQTQASERQDNEGRFTFDVRLTAPLIGLLVQYRGWLAAQEPPYPVTSAS